MAATLKPAPLQLRGRGSLEEPIRAGTACSAQLLYQRWSSRTRLAGQSAAPRRTRRMHVGAHCAGAALAAGGWEWAQRAQRGLQGSWEPGDATTARLQRQVECKQTYYCSIACQRRDWSAHSIVCKPVQQNFHKLEDNKSPFETKNVDVKDELYSSEVLECMNQLSASLKETYANKVHEEDYIPVKGEVCVAKYTIDQTWNRVLIQDVDVLQKKAQVLYIDYGNEEVIPVNSIHQLNRNIDLFPPCAIKCFVANVIPAEGSWSNDCITTIKSLLMEQFCSVKIVDIFSEEVVTFAVDVMLTSSGKLLDHVLIEMGYGLKPKGQNSKKQSADSSDLEDVGKMTAENKIVVDRSDLIPKVLTLNVGDEFCGVVAHIQTPEDFFCQQLQSGHKLAELQASLSKYCGQVSPRSDFYPTIGDVCCAQFSEDGQWYRASVLAYASEESVLIGYVDYGNFEILSLTRLCPITPKLLELPMQAIKCVLAGVKPSLGIWTPEAICLMKNIVQNKMMTVKVVDKLENSSLVELIDRSVTPHISVTRVLIDTGFAVGNKGVVADKPGDVKETDVPLGVEAKVSPLEWTWVELAVDETVDVVVCMMYSPGEFYCHVLKEDGLYTVSWSTCKTHSVVPTAMPLPRHCVQEIVALKKLSDLNKLLADYCQQKLPNDFKAEIGQPCCAFFVGDGNWYRALVKEILPTGNIKVRFVDYGNTEEVAADELQMIPSEFLELPFQGVQCWLAEDDFWYRAVVLGTSDADVKVLYADYGNIETLPLCRVQPIPASHLQLPFQIIKCSFEGRHYVKMPSFLLLEALCLFLFAGAEHVVQSYVSRATSGVSDLQSQSPPSRPGQWLASFQLENLLEEEGEGGSVPAFGEPPGEQGSWEQHRIMGWAAVGAPQEVHVSQETIGKISAASKMMWCSAVVDILFLIDGSHSVGKGSFERSKHFAITVCDALDINLRKVRVGAVQFSSAPRLEFPLDAFSTQQEVKAKIKGMVFKGGRTETGHALKYLLRKGFPGGRNASVPQVLVIVTDGRSQGHVALPAKQLKQRGVAVFAVGVRFPRWEELHTLASEPWEQHILMAEQVEDAANGLFSTLSGSAICTITSPAPKLSLECRVDVLFLLAGSAGTTPEGFLRAKAFVKRAPVSSRELHVEFSFSAPDVTLTRGCQAQSLDLVFMLDASASVGPENFAQMQSFTAFRLDTHLTRAAVLRAMSQAPYLGGAGSTGMALLHIYDKKLRDNGVSVLVVGVGPVLTEALRRLAGPRDSLIHVAAYEDLRHHQDMLMEWICQEAKRPVNPCRPSPCLNKGTCVLHDGSYRCECRAGGEGPHCERRYVAPAQSLQESSSPPSCYREGPGPLGAEGGPALSGASCLVRPF
ncbi:tudor domain-containing protein 1 [Camelus ferus]|nr:tudor domain-containing protein 1 [Camelus ferus]